MNTDIQQEQQTNINIDEELKGLIKQNIAAIQNAHRLNIPSWNSYQSLLSVLPEFMLMEIYSEAVKYEQTRKLFSYNKQKEIYEKYGKRWSNPSPDGIFNSSVDLTDVFCSKKPNEFDAHEFLSPAKRNNMYLNEMRRFDLPRINLMVYLIMNECKKYGIYFHTDNPNKLV
jgi:hypothetical protein